MLKRRAKNLSNTQCAEIRPENPEDQENHKAGRGEPCRPCPHAHSPGQITGSILRIHFLLPDQSLRNLATFLANGKDRQPVRPKVGPIFQDTLPTSTTPKPGLALL